MLLSEFVQDAAVLLDLLKRLSYTFGKRKLQGAVGQSGTHLPQIRLLQVRRDLRRRRRLAETHRAGARHVLTRRACRARGRPSPKRPAQAGRAMRRRGAHAPRTRHGRAPRARGVAWRTRRERGRCPAV